MLPKRVVILGAGYAGLTATLALQKKKLSDHVEITLINKYDYHYQTIWLHRNAVGVNSKQMTAFKLDELVDPNQVQLVYDCVTEINSADQQIHTDNGVYSYDYLVVALGSEIDSFQIPGLKEHAESITTLDQSSRLFERIEAMLDRYSKTDMSENLHIVIGGGGFTGVELLGELTDQLVDLCERAGIQQEKIKLTSIEHQPTVLPEFDLELGEYAMQRLEQRGVEFHLSTYIKLVRETSLEIEQLGLIRDIPVDLFVWTAGVKGNQLIDQSDFPSELGRVEVEADLTVPHFSNVFVIGDVSRVRDQSGKEYLPNADIAIQQGKLAAKNLQTKINGKGELSPFVFKERGTIASIGKSDAIGITGKRAKLFGGFASFLKKITNYIFLYQMGGVKLIWMHIKKKR